MLEYQTINWIRESMWIEIHFKIKNHVNITYEGEIKNKYSLGIEVWKKKNFGDLKGKNWLWEGG